MINSARRLLFWGTYEGAGWKSCRVFKSPCFECWVYPLVLYL